MRSMKSFLRKSKTELADCLASLISPNSDWYDGGGSEIGKMKLMMDEKKKPMIYVINLCIYYFISGTV